MSTRRASQTQSRAGALHGPAVDLKPQFQAPTGTLAERVRKPPREPKPEPVFRTLAPRVPKRVGQPATVADLFDRLLATHAVDPTEMKRQISDVLPMPPAAVRKLNAVGNDSSSALWKITSDLCEKWTFDEWGDGAIGCRNIAACLYFVAKVLTQGAMHPDADHLMSYFPKDESWFAYKGRFLGFYLKEIMYGERNRLSASGERALANVGDVKFATLMDADGVDSWVETINRDCAINTQGKIKKIVNADLMRRADLECVLMCAEYMKVTWKDLFLWSKTEKDAAFHGYVDGAPEVEGKCQMMKNDKDRYRLFEGEYCHAVFLPTEEQEGLGPGIQIMAVLPKSRNPAFIEKASNEIAEKADQVLDAGRGSKRAVTVEIPRMEVKMEARSILRLCKEVFPKSLFAEVQGLTESYNESTQQWRSVNFLSIGAIEHATYVMMNELGAEAAAVTAAASFRSLGASSEPETTLRLRFDRPYILYIVDTGDKESQMGVPAILYKATIMHSKDLQDVKPPDAEEYRTACEKSGLVDELQALEARKLVRPVA